MKLNLIKIINGVGLGVLMFGGSLYANLEFSEPETLSNNGSVDGDGLAFKAKIIGMSNGMLVSVYGDAVPSAHNVYDLKSDEVRKARDIFARTCMPTSTNDYCSSQSSWSEAINISNTADLSSISTKWEKDSDGLLATSPTPFYGDSEKPNIFNAGTYAVVSWVDKYCPSDEQRIVSYIERNGLEVPFSCVYESHINFADATPTWTTNRLTSGIRDAKQDVNKGVSSVDKKGQWIVTWQEDPLGLKIGGGDGPGDGASGANVSHGTDIWYSYTNDLKTIAFSEAKRFTNNQEKISDKSHGDPVFESDGTEVVQLEAGTVGASRANTAIVNISGTETLPTVIVTYEETKGTNGLDNGKYVRYHALSFDKLVALEDSDKIGAIISDPKQNARRVRFVTQVNPSSEGMRMGIFWREGNPVEGGPGDVMVRLAYKNTTDTNSSGLRAEDMMPKVDANAYVDAYADAILLTNESALNVSSNTVPWSPVGGEIASPSNTLADATDKNAYEDARAHRAVIKGNDFYIGYSYAKDWAVATYTDMDNYNFWIRSYDASMNTWTDAKNVSNITDVKTHVKEPRLVGMPGNGPGCLTPSDPATITNPENCQNGNLLLIAWGVESNVYEHIGGSVEGDIFYTRSYRGIDFEDIVTVPGIGTSNRFESQLRTTPAGNIVFTVWNEKNNDVSIGGTYAGLSVSTNPTSFSTEAIGTTQVSSSSSGLDSYSNASILLLVLSFLGISAFMNSRKLAK